MCRYAMTSYKPHYACFECRKTFKRRLMWDIRRDNTSTVEAKCPQCGSLMANMGLDFASPPKDDIKAWEHIKRLYSVGITFHSCGCTGPGYIPNSKDRLMAYFEELLKEYNNNLNFWRQRIEPANKKEIDRENSKHWDEISKVPYELRSPKDAISNEEAKKYWFDQIMAIEQKLTTINKTDSLL
jgi:DNA-directed RNA polymerase subunit RPC12/RpoP